MTYLRGVLETNITEILAVLEEFSEEMTDLHIQQGHTSEELAQTSESVAQLEVLSTGEKHSCKKEQQPLLYLRRLRTYMGALWNKDWAFFYYVFYLDNKNSSFKPSQEIWTRSYKSFPAYDYVG